MVRQKASAHGDCGGRPHTLNRSGTIVDNERLRQNFSVDTQLESTATGDIDHTLLTGVDFMRMRTILTRRLVSAPSIDLYNNYHPNTLLSAALLSRTR